MTGFLTIEGFESLTKQQLFDISLSHIRTTRVKSTRNNGDCTYAGTGCAAAPFLREEGRDAADKCGGPDIGGTGWYGVISKGLAPPHEDGLIRSIQSCHDEAPDDVGFMEYFENAMEHLAKNFSLTYTPENV